MFEINTTYEGFTYLGERQATNVKGTAHVFRHNVTDALVVYIDAPTNKKCFSMSFRTPAHDDTGVTHIIEHSVLEGSKKYPASEALFHLEKHSVADDTNAYTANECTCYHFSSRNQKDFDILFDYYMDGIMHPRFLNDASIFLREGWHLENTKNGKVKVSGIVFNEMKAHMLNKFSIEYNGALACIFPNTCYSYEAGGDICSIPLLDYPEAVKYYKKYYHPSNSSLVLYGSLDIMKYLKQLNEEFFEGYKLRNYKFSNYKVKTKAKTGTIHFGIKPTTTTRILEHEKNDVWLTYAKYDHFTRLESIVMHLMLFYTLNYNDHKVRYNMLTNNLCKDMSLVLGDAMPGAYYGMIFENVPEDVNERIVNNFIDNLKKIRDDGIDYKNMKALENLLKRYYYTKYVNEEYVDRVNSELLRGVDPFKMSIKECFEIIEDKLDNDLAYFSKFVDNFLIHAQAFDVTVFRPDPNFKKNLLKELDEVVNPKKNKWTNEERKQIRQVEQFIANSIYDSEPATVKHEELTREDIDTSVKWNAFKKVDILGKSVNAYVTTEKPGSAFVRLNFDISNLSTKETAIFNVLANNLFCNFTRKKTDVENSYDAVYFFEEYETKINFINIMDKDRVKRELQIKLEVKNENIEKAMALLGDILINSTYGHKVTTYSNIYWYMLDTYGRVSEAPQSICPMVTKAHYSKADNMRNNIIGLDGANYLYEVLVENNSDEGMKRLARKCQKIFERVFNQSRMTMFIAGEKEVLETLRESLERNLSNMPKELDERDAIYVPVTRGYAPKHEAISIETLVQYNAVSVDVRNSIKDFKGNVQLVCSMLQEWVAHKLVRELGNAYGSSIKYADGIFTFTSFRDPSFERTLCTFFNFGFIFQSLSNLEEVNDFEKCKIAIAGRKNLFDTEIDKIECIEGYINEGKSEEDMKLDAEKVFETTSEDVQAVCNMINEAINAGKFNYFSIGDINTLRKSRKGVLSQITVY